MFQRLSIIKFLQRCPSQVEDASNQAAHIIQLAREHFDHIRQVVLVLPPQVTFSEAAFFLRHTEWTRIRELYRSIWKLIIIDRSRETDRERGLHRLWPMLENAVDLEGEAAHNSLIGEETLEQQITKVEVIKRTDVVIDFVRHILRQLVPAHVFVLGPVPCDAELQYFGFTGLRRVDIYELFSTESDRRNYAIDVLYLALESVGVDVPLHSDDLTSCRELGFRVHAMLASLRSSKERALRWRKDNQLFIESLSTLCVVHLADDNRVENSCHTLLRKLQDVLKALSSIESTCTWRDAYERALLAFRVACNSPEARAKGIALAINEACIHFVDAVLMADYKDSLYTLTTAILEDSLREKDPNYLGNDKLPLRMLTRSDFEKRFLTPLVFDVTNGVRDSAKYGQEIVAGEQGHKIRQVLSGEMTLIFDQVQKCASALEPQICDVTEHEPSIALPTGRLQQSKVFSVFSHVHGGCAIVDIGFRCDGSYKPERRQGLLSIEFHQGIAGPTLSDAIISIAKEHGKTVRLQGSATIGDVRRNVKIECRLDGGASSQGIGYKTFIDGADISEENPVDVVMATDDTDPTSPQVQFLRIAQYISGMTWRKDTDRLPIADKAVQVAAAVEAEYRLNDPTHGDTYRKHFDVLNSVVYLASKQLLVHLDDLRKLIEQKWESSLNQHKQHALAACLLEALKNDSRVLALTGAELLLAKAMLQQLQLVVREVQVDNLSFVSKCSDLRERSKKPSISFVHLSVVGHLDSSKVIKFCDLVKNTSLRLLVVASPSTKAFAELAGVVKTISATNAFRSSKITQFSNPIFVSGLKMATQDFSSRAPMNAALTLLKRTCTLHVELFVERSCRNFYERIRRSRIENRLTIVCRRGQHLLPRLDGQDFLDLRSESNPLAVVRERLFAQQNVSTPSDAENLVVVVEDPTPSLALFVNGASVIDANLMFAPVAALDDAASTTRLASLLHLDPTKPIGLSVQWAAVQAAMTALNAAPINFNDFISAVPCCEWLDHRCRVQLYFLVVWGVPLETTAAVVPSIRNVCSLPLKATLLLSDEALSNTNVESAPSYLEIVVGGTVTLEDALDNSFALGQDIPWNRCRSAWSTAAPFSSATLMQVLSIYPFQLRVLCALGPSLFHTLSGVELFVEGRPLSWAVAVARKLAAATEMFKLGILKRNELSQLSVLKWLFLCLGWNDRINECVDRFGQRISPIEFDAEDFLALDSSNIVMDILEECVGTRATSRRSAMSSTTRHEISLILATLDGSPRLFATQPQIADYFLRPSREGGISEDSSILLMDTLLDPSQAFFIGAPFLNILKDSTLLRASALRGSCAVNDLWIWCNENERPMSHDIGLPLKTIVSKLSCNAWGFLLATMPDATESFISLLHSRSITTNGFGLEDVVNAAAQLASEVPTALDAITCAFLRCTVARTHLSLHNCPSLSHLEELIRSTNDGNGNTNILRYAMHFTRSEENRSYRQFRVELDDSRVMPASILNLQFLRDATASNFPVAVIFFKRCLTAAGRRALLRNVTELLRYSRDEASVLLEQMPCPSEETLEFAAAALWLHLPVASCPLSINASAALQCMRRVLSATTPQNAELQMSLPDWPQEEVRVATSELQDVVDTFRYFVETEYEIVPYVALALIGWVHYLPRGYLQALGSTGIVECVPQSLSTIIADQSSSGWPRYELKYALRPLPADLRTQFFVVQKYHLDLGPNQQKKSFDISHGVSNAIITQNLSFFATLRINGNATEDWEPVDATASRLCIILWFKALGLFANCLTEKACRDAFLALDAQTESRLKPALQEFDEALKTAEIKLRATAIVRSATLPSSMELHVLRHSALVKLFCSDSLQGVSYTLQTLSSVLVVLPQEAQRPADLFRHELNQKYYGEAYLANAVMSVTGSHQRKIMMETCFRIIACEIGYRLGQCWVALHPSKKSTVAQNVVDTPFQLLADDQLDVASKGCEMLLIIVDVALEMLQGDAYHRAELCSFITMAIGFQDEAAQQHLLVPLFDLMGGIGSDHMKNCTEILSHSPTTLAVGSQQRAFLFCSVACEAVFWRDAVLRGLCHRKTGRFSCAGFARTITLLRPVNRQMPIARHRQQRTDLATFAQLSGETKLPARARERRIRHTPALGRVSLFREPITHLMGNFRHDASDGIPSEHSDDTTKEHDINSLFQSTGHGNFSTAIIDISAITHIDIPKESIVTGGQFHVHAGLGCALVRVGEELRIVPLKELRNPTSQDATPASGDTQRSPNTSSATEFTICCYFEDYGEAWDFCASRHHPSTLVGNGFLLVSSSNGGWRLLIGLAHGESNKSIRPWHLLAFHVLLGLPLRGPSEDRLRGGRFQLLEWLCRRVCRGLARNQRSQPTASTTTHNVESVEDVRQLVCALVTSEDEQKERFNDVLQKFLGHVAEKLRDRNTDNVEELILDTEIRVALEAMSVSDRALLDRCGVMEKYASARLMEALSCSLDFLASSHALSIIAPGPNEKFHHATIKKLFGQHIAPMDLRKRLSEVRYKEELSRSIADRLIGTLQCSDPQPVTAVQPAPSDLLDTLTTSVHDVSDTLEVGTGLQQGSREDVFFGVAKSYDSAELVFLPIERKERYHYSLGLVVGFLLDKRLLHFSERGVNKALMLQWTLQVLRSPLPILWKEWFVLHLRTKAVWMPVFPVANTPTNCQRRIIAHLLAWRCESGSVREILCTAFGDLPSHCIRSNRIYGVIAMANPPVNEWLDDGYDIQVQDFSASALLPDDEEAFRLMTKRFNPMTTHVVVYGFDKAPMSDTLLKWLCEYTFRYPWRFFVLVNCDTTTNLPENRDRVSNLLTLRNRKTYTITLPVDVLHRDWKSFRELVPKANPQKEQYSRCCDWSKQLERDLVGVRRRSEELHEEAHHAEDLASPQVLLIHLVSPPGGGKSTFMQSLEGRKDIAKTFVRFDCSDDRLVEEALRSLLSEVMAGVDLKTNDTVLVADEYHMLPERKKIEFMQWAAENLSRVKIVMIANRSDPLDTKLIEELRKVYPSCKTIRSIRGRISALKVREVIQTTCSGLAEKKQTRSFFTFLCTLRGMLGDDAVSLRLEEHFPRSEKSSHKVNNYEFSKKLQDKLIMFGQDSILRILNAYDQLTMLVEKELSGIIYDTEREKIIFQLYRDSLLGPPTKLIVFTAMLIPLLLYVDPTDEKPVQPCDRALCYRDVVDNTNQLRRAPPAIKLAMWVRYVLAYVGKPEFFDDDDMEVLVNNSLRKLKVVDFPDFPIIQGESSLFKYPLSELTATFVNHHDLTDLDWIIRTVARRMAVNWLAVAQAWRQTPVTDSNKLCTIIEQAGPATVFMAMSPSNVLQLLKRNPTGAFHEIVVQSYPYNRIVDESLSDQSPYFFATYTEIVNKQWESPAALEAKVSKLLRLDVSPNDEAVRRNASRFLMWISSHGSMVSATSNHCAVQTDLVIKFVVLMSKVLKLSQKELADVWRGKYLAPVAELFSEIVHNTSRTLSHATNATAANDQGNVLIPLPMAAAIVSHGRIHDKWPFAMKLLHRILSNRMAMLSEREAIYLLDMGVLLQAEVPPRLVGALLQAEPHGWLSERHQNSLLCCNVVIDANDLNNEEQYTLNACRNVTLGLRKRSTAPVLQYAPIRHLFAEMHRTDPTTSSSPAPSTALV
ncbi:Hypothetical protein, putative [Bodo saltans]|uniref:Uncharacterized protein n=1 Tax=Bodo saltans TaxID=75058 RepID=A0A0S4KH17_BODSA|nr:Hypothetical protein, putative [Bodo saltans]|eukprot:CUI11139.1 Hypothetical protein, putative [Bodo saltans]